MSQWFGPIPEASVIIPTYNQRDLLHATLVNLCRQTLPRGAFEVIVADDGSSDDSKAVAESFQDRLRLRYVVQPDLGFRAGTARNIGARLATADLLIFLDTGSMVGPSFVVGHITAHWCPGPPLGVIGMSYGYNPEDPINGLDPALLSGAPEILVARHGNDPRFHDIRAEEFARCDGDLSRKLVPWMLFWSGNCSVPAAEFRRVGGFDEDYRGWGGEDIDLGRRLARSGLTLQLRPELWAVVAPHERDMAANDQSLITNLTRMLGKAPELDVEIGWGVVAKFLIMPWEQECERLHGWIGRPADDVGAEIATLLGRPWPPGARLAIIGCGTTLPDIPDGVELVLIDFDERVLAKLHPPVAHTAQLSVGIRTTLPDGIVDAVIVTSRLSGLWDQWGDLVGREAARLARPGAPVLMNRP